MPDASTRRISITLPSSLTAGGEPTVLQLAIVDDAKISGGKRAITRTLVDANSSSPGRRRRVEWNIWGPIGASLQSSAANVSSTNPSRGLSTDLVRNLETRWPRRLISAGADVLVPLTGKDPAGAGAYFGTAYFGTSYFGSPVTDTNVVVFDEQTGYLFAGRGEYETQIDYSTWMPVDVVVLAAAVKDAALWRQYGRIALGSTAPMQTRTLVTSVGSTYVDTSSTSPSALVYANAVKRGSDRAWIIDASSGANSNFLGYTLDGFVTMASPFQVGDPDVGLTGIGPFGPFTMVGANDNISSFTDQGKPVPLSRALLSHNSPVNGSQWSDPGFGWNYYISAIGLRATNGATDNPIGIGERLREFTGHGGLPTAIYAERGEQWVAYTTPTGEVYMYRGVFSRIARSADEQALNFGGSGVFYSQTAQTGEYDLYPFHYYPSATVNAMFSSSTPGTSQQSAFIWNDGTNMYYQLIAENGRDDLDPNTTYSTGGGTWWGTTLDTDTNLLKTLRLARFHTTGLTSGSSWKLSFAFDPAPDATTTATYVDISTVTTNGYQVIEPVSAGVPLSSISGRTMKPRLTQVAGGSGADTTPPEINGTLEVEYDERPDQLEQITVAVNMTATGYSNNDIYDTLQSLVGSQTDGPFAVQFPSDLPAGVSTASGGGQKYAMISAVTARQDISDNGIESVNVVFDCWPAAAALG